MKHATVLFFYVFTQFAFAQTSYSDKGPSGYNHTVKQHDRAFYEKNTNAYTYTDENGNKMPYRLFLPPNYDPQKKYPLLFTFHGAGSRGDDNLKQLRPWVAGWMDKQIQDEHPCIILMPQCPIKQKWVDVSWKDGLIYLKMFQLVDL